MTVGVEMRLQNTDDGYCDAVKLVGILNSIAGVGCFVKYYQLHRRLLQMTCTHATTFEQVVPVVELLMLLAGIIPPFVEGTVGNPKLSGQFGPHVDYSDYYSTDELRNARIHVDAFGVLVFVRLPLMGKWIVASSLLSSPAFLSWKFNVSRPQRE